MFTPDDLCAPPPVTLYLPGGKRVEARSLSVADDQAIELACGRPTPTPRDKGLTAEDAKRYGAELHAFNARCNLLTVAVACGFVATGTKLDGTEGLRWADTKYPDELGTVGAGSVRDENRAKYARAVWDQMGGRLTPGWVESAMRAIMTAGGFDDALKDSSAPDGPQDPAAE